MIGYILNEAEATSIKGVFFDSDTFFWPVLDINGVEFLMLSEQNKEVLVGTQWEWVLTLPTGEYVAPPPTPFPNV